MNRKGWLILIILLFLAVLPVVIFLLTPRVLFSPATTISPQLNAKLTTKISSVNLDFSSAAPGKKISAVPHFLVFNLDSGKVYAAKGEKEKISPASFTKLLTAQVALDLGYPNQLLTATATSVDKIPTVLGLKAGEQLTLSDLLRAAIATSANDAAATIAQGLASQNGTDLPGYILLMNQKVKLLGMNDSQFANPEGYDDPSQFTTVSDLARLVYNTVKNYPEILAAAASDRQDIQAGPTHGFYYISNWNGLLGVYPGVFGLKIAYTANAGSSTIVLAERKGIRLAAIVSGTKNKLSRDTAAAALLDLGFVAEKIPPVNLSGSALRRRYQVWDDLIKKTRALANQISVQP